MDAPSHHRPRRRPAGPVRRHSSSLVGNIHTSARCPSRVAPLVPRSPPLCGGRLYVAPPPAREQGGGGRALRLGKEANGASPEPRSVKQASSGCHQAQNRQLAPTKGAHHPSYCPSSAPSLPPQPLVWGDHLRRIGLAPASSESPSPCEAIAPGRAGSRARPIPPRPRLGLCAFGRRPRAAVGPGPRATRSCPAGPLAAPHPPRPTPSPPPRRARPLSLPFRLSLVLTARSSFLFGLV